MIPDEKVIETLEKNAAALKRLESYYTAKEAEADRVKARIPTTADAILKRGMVEPHEAQELAAALQDHEKCLELLKRAALFKSAEEEGRLGQQLPGPGQKKSAAQNSSLPPGGYIGRRTSEPSEAWLKCERDLGL